MKKIINGKIYDTSTAREIGVWANSWDLQDLSHVEEHLYRKKTGEFFLCGQGGAASKYAQSTGQNSWVSGCQILPLTWDAAREWAEEHMDTAGYEAIFGPVAEDDSRTVVTISLSVGTLERAKRAAAQQGQSLSGYIETLLDGRA